MDLVSYGRDATVPVASKADAPPSIGDMRSPVMHLITVGSAVYFMM